MLDADKEPCPYCKASVSITSMPYCCEAMHHVTMYRTAARHAENTVERMSRSLAPLRQLWQDEHKRPDMWPDNKKLACWAVERIKRARQLETVPAEKRVECWSCGQMLPAHRPHLSFDECARPTASGLTEGTSE